MSRLAGVFHFSRKSKVNLILTLSLVLLFSSITLGQLTAKDPGIRGGSPGVGGVRAGLTSDYAAEFSAALLRFQEVNSVNGQQPGSDSQGLGPRFNGTSCAGCHIQPAVGGTSPPTNNPQIGFATVFGGSNIVPSFILPNGPVREVRFVRNPDGSPDGGVHDLYVITGMPDAVGCNIKQPDFVDAVEDHNAIFRIPTPVFGAGIVEEITDANLLTNLATDAPTKHSLGIHGRPNRSGNDGTITRFGWKAQNKSLVVFAGEAYNVEQGVTNRVFPNERDDTPGCVLNQLPEDAENFSTSGPSPTSDLHSDTENFAMFMRLTAPPTPIPDTPSIARGRALFAGVGCAFCHSPSLATGSKSLTTGQSSTQLNPLSDFMLHHMGAGLADGVSQGLAGPDEFRTAPLWGLGQRAFFLHDGRTSDLLEAIRQHHSTGSEANAVITRFHGLTETQKQDILNFLRSL